MKGIVQLTPVWAALALGLVGARAANQANGVDVMPLPSFNAAPMELNILIIGGVLLIAGVFFKLWADSIKGRRPEMGGW